MFISTRFLARRILCAVVSAFLAAFLPAAHAEDIDLFVASPLAGSTVAANIMLMVDNSANWARESQKWPDGSGGTMDQGVAELQAIINVLAMDSLNANVGFAGFTGSGSSAGGYVRFGIRDMTVPANKTALMNVLAHIKGRVNSSIEKINDNAEAAALYEMYKYFKSLPVFRGAYASGNNPASNVDIAGNWGNPTGTNATAHANGLTGDYAINGTNYSGPSASTCGRSYVIFIVNNAGGQGSSVPEGAQSYEGVSAGAPLPLIPGVSGVSWTDEWARFLYNNGISVYVLDAYNAQQNVSHSKVLQRAARVAGGEYYAVKNQSDIEVAIKKILANINAINTTFAAASLPISATNRSQNVNQVFIGMFRPDGAAKPRWMGNLKQYQLGKTASGVDLVDQLGNNAVNAQTGFVNECAASLWTTDSGSYWESVYGNASAQSGCTVFPTIGGVVGSAWSDSPDGATVEKGGAAEVLRKGNNPPTTNTTPTWTSNRTILTYSASAQTKLAPLSTALTGWSSTLHSWVLGTDDPTTTASAEFTNTSETPRTRPSIHGDVIHSRPLPVNYSGSTGVTVYYGSNDGMLRAVDANTGKERWAYVAPEHYSRFQRLHDNSPLVKYPNVDPTLNPQPKDYFFDGSLGLYQKSDNSKIWIFPSMRRGGRMLYGFDVTDPASPILKWRVGCPNMTDDTDCTTGMSAIGQTWSLPSVAYLKGYSTTTPVVIVGGGYDSCEDANQASPACSNRKGGVVYVLNADTGAVVASFAPSGAGSFAADLALADVDIDGSVDFAYASDTKGNVYRIDFSAFNSAAPTYRGTSAWGIRKVASTTGAGRKFLYPPALLRVGNHMYVALGSGDRERPLITNYPYTNPITNRFYVFLDDLTVAHDSTSPAAIALDDTSAGIKDYSGASSTSCDEAGVTPSTGFKGWFMNLPGTGEQVVTSSLIAAGMVAFNTNRPLAGSANACVSPLGEARGYWLNLANASGGIGTGTKNCGGDRSSVFVGGGLTPSPTLARVVIGGKTTTVAIGAANREGGASVPIDPQEVKPTINSKRRNVYWKSNTAD